MRRVKNIMCVIDSEEAMDTAIAHATRIAEDHQADISFVSVLKAAKSWRSVFQNKEAFAKEMDQVEERRRNAIESCIRSRAPSLKANIVFTSGIAFLEIIKLVIQNECDLVVKCAEDVEWVDRMLGSEDMHLIRKCPCPVLMVKRGQKDGFSRILATVDVNDDSNDAADGRVQEQLNQQVLAYSAALSLPELSEMHIGGAWEAYAEDFLRHGAFSKTSEETVDQYVEKEHKDCLTKLEALVGKMDQLLGEAAVQYLQPRPHLVKGKASKEIPKMVESYDIDLIVMGTVGRVGIPGLLIGNTAESILEQTKCSVLAIKPEGFKTPIEC